MTAVGDQLPTLTTTLTRADLVRYAGASGDFNPIHWSDRFATAIGMPGVVAHGMLTMGLALRVVTDWVGDPARITGYKTRFARPIVVPDTDEGIEVEVTGTVTAVTDDTITVGLEVTSAGEKVLANARVEVAA